jgi:segregation and condensation protein B
VSTQKSTTGPVEQAESAAVENPRGTATSSVVRSSLDEGNQLRSAIEAVLFVLDTPIDVTSLAAALERPVEQVAAALADLATHLDERGSGIELVQIAGGVRLYTRRAYAPWVASFLMDGLRSRLTQAALETLAVVAYRQPVTRARIAAIRGVNVDGVVRTLTSRGLISEVGTDPETGGGLYRTTTLFLEKMGLTSVSDLPSLAPLLPELDRVDIDEL